MSRYIKLEDLQKFPIRKDHYDKKNGSETYVFGVEDVLEYAKYLPTADVVEVVRCKDCQYWTGKDYDGCCIKNGLATRFAKEYCSYGERKDNGT